MSDDEQDGDVEEFVRALAVANIPTLLMVLTQFTGDTRWLDDPYRPVRQRGFGDNDSGGLPVEVQDEIRREALKAILQWRRDKRIAMPNPSSEVLAQMLTWAMGESVPNEYGDMIAYQVGLTEAVTERRIDIQESFEVLIIGAGVAGLCAAYNLRRVGIPFRIVERETELGGTWRDNHYPGAGVDVPNHLYEFTFAPNDWSMYFALRDEISEYLDDVADRLSLRSSITFETSVKSLKYKDELQRWEVTLQLGDGSVEVVYPNVVVSAVGIFNPPKIPDIVGLSSFKGSVAHTADWPLDFDLADKRVALIGSGASAMQVGPAIKDRVKSLSVFQRSPHWAAPFEQFHRNVPTEIRMLFREVPLYLGWYRARLAWTFNDRVYPTIQKDPNWNMKDQSLNAHNEAQRKAFVEYIKSEIGDRRDLLEKVVPTYPLFGKRMLLDNGWYRMLRDSKVTLVTTPIASVGPNGVTTDDGSFHEVDAIVLATGFDVQRYLSGFEVVGRSGQSLRDAWNDTDPRAYMAGLTVPDFPNFFILYGPNSQPGHGGSVVVMMEWLMSYMTDALLHMNEEGIGVLECRQDVCEAYVAKVDAAHERMVWTHPGVSSYFRNENGRVVVIYPFRNVDLFQSTQHFDVHDYVTEPSRYDTLSPQEAAQRDQILDHGNGEAISALQTERSR